MAMIVFEIYHKTDHLEVKVKTKYYDDGAYKYHLMHKLGFKFSAIGRHYFKTYRDLEYTKERFQPDLDETKRIFNCQMMIRRFKMVKEKVVA